MGSQSDVANNLDVDDSFNISIIGSYQDTVDFDPGSGELKLTARRLGPTTYESTEFHLILDSNFNFVTAKKYINRFFITEYSESSGDVIYNSQNEIYTFRSKDQMLGFSVEKSSNSGVKIWDFDVLNNIGSRGIEVYNFTIDNNEDIIVVGGVRYETDFDPGPNTALVRTLNNTYESFIAKYNKDGNFIWVKTLRSLDSRNRRSSIYDVTTDVNNNIIVSGFYHGKYDFNLGPDSNIFISSGDYTIQKPSFRCRHIYS